MTPTSATTDIQRATLEAHPEGRAMLREIDKRRACMSPAWYERQLRMAVDGLPTVKGPR